VRLHETPIWDDHWAADELAADGEFRYVLLSQGFNLRLVMILAGDITGYEWGWCFPRDPEVARRALAAWDPQTQDEPTGWHKRPTGQLARRAPHRDRAPDHNRPRCAHGAYSAQCHSIGCGHWKPNYGMGEAS
jgi:hypothetical protein